MTRADVFYNEKSYTIASVRDDRIIVQDNTVKPGLPCKRVIKIEEEPENTYRILKTKICARGGASGLISFVEKCYRDHFMETCANYVMEALTCTCREWRG